RTRAPSAREILDGSANPALLWRSDPGGDGALPLALGTGDVPSGLVWRGDPDARVPGADDRDGTGAVRGVLGRSARLPRTPRAAAHARSSTAGP
ncbi:hypothetical protein, partial [Clavibacter phaseoli]|uniref:hypothetical protein n=1 Tax=Clavibacter phaseoli TaxID=1734031 RepID=UPI001C716C5D